MSEQDIKKILQEIQANLEKISPEERLRLLRDLRQQIQSVNQDMEQLIQMSEDESRRRDLEQRIKEM